MKSKTGTNNCPHYDYGKSADKAPTMREDWADKTYYCPDCDDVIVGMHSMEDGEWWIPKSEKCPNCEIPLDWSGIDDL